jgi:CheY-like chemotaxis protein
MPHTTAAPQILVVDDDLVITQLVAGQLNAVGYCVITCLDPLDALTRCATDDITVFITDWHMPGFSGLELLEVLQQRHPQVRRVLLTAAPAEPEVRAALTEGLVQALVEKPWTRSELARVVAEQVAAAQ